MPVMDEDEVENENGVEDGSRTCDEPMSEEDIFLFL